MVGTNMHSKMLMVFAALGLSIGPASAQVVMSGRLYKERVPGSSDLMPLTAVTCFASLPGDEAEPHGFRSWEMAPSGWYRLSGMAGRYSILFTTPASFVRPVLLTNVYTRPGDKFDRNVLPEMDYAVLQQSAWDEKRASRYFQTFIAKSTSITHVGFKLVHDGIDGIGPGSQDVIISIHRKGEGTPDTWPQVGPEMLVPQVDCGGPKDYTFSAGWNSGEVPTKPGEVYAVQIRPKDPKGTFQAWWRVDEDKTTDCYRIGELGTTGWQGRDMWLVVDGDSDGLLIPYNKRVHRQFGEFAGSGRKWAQTYVAQGRGLAGAIMYAALGTAEPPLKRQRCRVRVRRGGPDGPVVGIEKIAIGEGNYTGDASWGMFGAVYEPGEVPLEPGQTYSIEFESMENYETLHGFINIKGAISSEKPGFNPYRKHASDTYEQGTAFAEGTKAVDFDLDMQIVEYAAPDPNWAKAVTGGNLLQNGDMEAGEFNAEKPSAGRPAVWKTFTLDPATGFEYTTDSKTQDRILRVIGSGATGTTVDGGYVQRVEGLSRVETYRLEGQIRCSWPLDVDQALMVGYDPTGQTEDAEAATIEWKLLPPLYGHFLPYESEPIRPAKDAISVWLRGRTTVKTDYPFKADFDDFSLRKVNTAVPGAK